MAPQTLPVLCRGISPSPRFPDEGDDCPIRSVLARRTFFSRHKPSCVLSVLTDTYVYPNDSGRISWRSLDSVPSSMLQAMHWNSSIEQKPTWLDKCPVSFPAQLNQPTHFPISMLVCRIEIHASQSGVHFSQHNRSQQIITPASLMQRI